ncbi:hypothetical protein NB694_000332 [Pantoea ananatis]|uniref:phage capsid protein n=1 Tax=Pantoea ananas TaxID=553 RepID=UPI0021F7CD11|nr:phage capsid protein [Pantoea ananatis]MCW0310532.1 hypothetical protein [Pantoea ananatis]
MPQDMATNSGKITSAFVQEFHRGFEIACQQEDSRLQAAVTDRGTITGASYTINDMGIVEMTDRVFSDRFSNTPWSMPDTGTRVAMMADADVYVPVEKVDLPKLLAEPQGEYQNLLVAAANRKKDRTIYNAILSDIQRKSVAADGTQSTTAQSFAASQILWAQGAVGTAQSPAKPITKKDLIRLRALFRKNEADSEGIYITYNSDMMTSILNDTTLTSADYLSVNMLQEGNVAGKWLGFNWIPYEKLNVDANGSVTAVAWTKSGVHFGTGINIDTDIGPRRDKRNIIQISALVSYGAGRANEQKCAALNFMGS